MGHAATNYFTEGATFALGRTGITPRGVTDVGGASRFFPTFRYEAKAPTLERPRHQRKVLWLRGDLTPEQVGHVKARLLEAVVQHD